MTKQQKFVIAILLFTSIFLPKFIQDYHFLTAKHFIFYCDDKCQFALHTPSDHCLIHDFVFSLPDNVAHFDFLCIKIEKLFAKYWQHDDKHIHTTIVSYYLRAPPCTFC